ncbi:BtrH N-terminal domain-containing protein [Aquisalimonas lutea]|uniref:BtrH N-terminal domain-containing protein n=1 Tax=Aquisalimonas lutea TaxID=1327750 RepID=UPI0025B61D7D|nr:BtrH N-terminal domain-containing protein [Aquisalimonas lutea]MDN3517108.1 BtrH N-terminal domain-containing protein [Aquisalimonas lutea]
MHDSSPSEPGHPAASPEVPGFRHQHAGHCESGVVSGLLSHAGLAISEPMAFGLSSSLIFAHLPFVRVGGVPLTSYRALPGHVLRGLRRAVGYRLVRQRFRSPAAARAAVDAQLQQGRPVGLQTSVFWLPYFPRDMRFHFNAHNLIVYGRDGDDYLISDPVFEHPQRCPADALDQARFARGAFAPRGLLYYVEDVPDHVDLDRHVPRAIRRTVRMNTRAPVPLVGLRAIRRLAGKLRRLPETSRDPRYRRLFVGSIVRMQEEIGTGGAGFRFMYASFLQEAAQRLDAPLLDEASAAMTDAGDHWRLFAARSARLCREETSGGYGEIADSLLACAEREARVYALLERFVTHTAR